jgi:hypothetical protein
MTFWRALANHRRRVLGQPGFTSIDDQPKFKEKRSMDFLSQLLRGISFVPALVSGIEGLFGDKPGAEKKDAAMSFLQNALSTIDAVATREIINPEQFKDGISKIIDGTVQCLNASTWCKQPPASHSQPTA